MIGIVAMMLGALAAVQEPPRFERFGLYVLVDDRPAAEAFYARLFGRDPQLRTPALTGFDVAGGLFAIVPRQGYGADTGPRGSVHPFIRVANVRAFHAHARSVAPASLPSDSVVEEGPFHFFRMHDPEGNMLEFFEVVQR